MAAVVTLALMGGLLGLGLAFAADILKVEADKRVQGVKERLPGLDCGACGFPGCEAFAEGIIEGEVDTFSQCKPGKNTHYDAIVEYLADQPNKDGSKVSLKR